MAQLAIKGHASRGKEVIEILEMLGGKNIVEYNGTSIRSYYFLNNNIICSSYDSVKAPGIDYYTLEEFLEKFPYRVGDKVKIAETGKIVSIEDMNWKNESCEVVYETCYDNDCVAFYSAIDLQPYKEETMERKPNLLQQLKEYFDNTPREVLEKEWNELSYLNEIGPTVDEYLECVKKYRQSNKYPKTYKECCEVLFPSSIELGKVLTSGYNCEKLKKFGELLICRDAYWKIAGEHMGLGKPWEFKLGSDSKEVVYAISVFGTGIMLDFYYALNCNKILVFPTEEMRDIFYENFKERIDFCKELL
jgi:hypothetical protein